MCGIAGYVSTRIRDGAAVLQRMNEVMIHRGPDEGGIHVNGTVGLAMRRLKIIDLMGGSQPMWNEDRTVGLVFNGEIYNFRELREQLEKKGHRFSSRSDTEVIVHQYEEEGVDCLDHLNGMFAFALYDWKQEQLFLARDRIGEKPLYYYFHNGDFIFASEIKSILTFPGLTPSLNLEALNMYLTYEYVPAPYTIYQNISKLQPAHSLLLKKGELSLRPYWRPSFRRLEKNFSLEEAVERLRDHVKRSVKMRTVSDVPLGAFLSGGLDSSFITAFLTQCSSRRVKTFNIAFENPSFDESKYAREVARHLGTDHCEERLTPQSMLQILPEMIQIMDEPFADASAIPTYLLSKFARRHVTVCLSGDGGDELFYGYPTYQAHQIASWLPGWMAKPARRLADLLPVSDHNISFDFKARRFTAGLEYEPAIRHQIWLGSFDPDQKQQLLLAEIRSVLKEKDEFGLLRKHWSECDSSDERDRVCHMDLRFYLQDDILFKVDRMSMAHSLEVRAPYLDHEFVEFVCSLKPDLKLKGLTPKYILKEAAKGLLPEKIIHRAKKGFGVPIAQWINSDLKEIFLDTLSEEKISREGLFNPRYIHRLLSEHLSQRKDHRKLLWTLFIFESWRQKKL